MVVNYLTYGLKSEVVFEVNCMVFIRGATGFI